MKTRIGGTRNAVDGPLLVGLGREPEVEFVQAPPNDLIRRLRSGELDAALVGSIEAIRLPGYAVASSLGVACHTSSRSARAFRRRSAPIRTVAVDQAAATSTALLRMLLAHRFIDDVAPGIRFDTVPSTDRPDELPHDLVLLIGDAGLAARAGDRDCWDLAREWHRWTRLPFVFALWVLRPGADAARVLPLLAAARTRGSRLQTTDGSDDSAHYELDGRDLDGLRRFWAECRSLQLGTQPDPRLLDCSPR